MNIEVLYPTKVSVYLNVLVWMGRPDATVAMFIVASVVYLLRVSSEGRSRRS